jgi:hypothetical protein
MIIDCDRCTARGPACADCAVTFITGDFHVGGRAGVAGHASLDAADLRALAALANAGMIPPLRYAPAMATAS